MKKRTTPNNSSIKSMDRINKYSGCLCKESSIDMIEELSLRFPYICVIDNVPDPYYLDKKVKLVELFSYHKLGLTNKYTHLFGDS